MKRCLLLLACFPLIVGCSTFPSGLVKSESGFEGAVTVVSTAASGHFGIVTVKVPYPGIRGEKKEGLARLVVSRNALESGRPLPAFCHVHYEKDVHGAKQWAERGWAVFTAAYTGEKEGYPIDAAVANGYNQSRAILHWARRLPFIDPARMHIDGGSQGGYMALVMSADAFPVTSTTADCPVVNWCYNLRYFEANKGVSKYPAKLEDSPLPVMCSVTMLADWCYKAYGNDLSNDTWYYLSPIACLDRITDPVLVTCATGDMLVPMEAMTGEHLHPIDAARFPAGYQRAFDALTPCAKARKRFEDLVPESARETFVIPLQENSFEVSLDMFKDGKLKPRLRPKNQDKPWSREKPWSLVYLDEGPPAPYAAHTTYEWALSPDSFVAGHQQHPITPELLTPAKLEWLLRRYARQLVDLPVLAEGAPANRLNFETPEQRDVLSGLLAYAALGAEFEQRLQTLYRACPIQPFGATLSAAALRGALQTLERNAHR